MSLRTRPPVLSNSPRVTESSIEQLIIWMQNEKIDIRPGYQRDPKWIESQTSGFIETIMMNGIIPELVLYKFQQEDVKIKSTHIWECFDGQNRLSVIWYYRNGIPITSNKRTFMIYWYIPETKMYVFYDKTPDTEAWALEYNDRTVEYLPTEDKNDFDNMMLNIKYVESPMSYDNRCREFSKLQNGTKVTGSDLYKNAIDIPIIQFMMSHGFEKRFKAKFCDSLTVNHLDFYLHNFIRMYLLLCSSASSSDDKRKIILSNDNKEIKIWIIKKSPKLTELTEHFSEFEEKMEDVMSFLTDYLPGVKIPPTYFHTLFAYIFLEDAKIPRALLATFVRNWVKCCPTEDKKLWQKPKTIDRLPFLVDRCILDIEQHFDTILSGNVPEIEKPVSSSVRLQIWNRDHGDIADTDKVHCPMGCGNMMTKRRHHCAHRIARANGGTNDPENLISTCISCNLEMGTMSTYEWREIMTGSLA